MKKITQHSIKAMLICLLVFLGIKETSAQSGYALGFSSSNQYVSVANATSLNFGASTDFTLEAWINYTDYANAGLVSKGTSNGTMLGYQMIILNERLVGEFGNGNVFIGSANGLQGTTPLNDGKWHHVAMVVARSSNNIKLYVDGNQEASVTNSIIGDNITNSDNLYIGNDRTPGFYFPGLMDEVRIWNTARTQSELQANKYNSVNAASSGLVAYYNFNAGSGTNVSDATTNANNGTINGSVSWVTSTANIAIANPGNALSFDGNNSVSISYNSSLDVSAGGELTIEAWINPTVSGNIITRQSYGYGLGLEGDGSLFFWDQGSQNAAIHSAQGIVKKNIWQHVAVTVKDLGSTLQIYFYVNGISYGPFTSNEQSINDGYYSGRTLDIGIQDAGSCNCNGYTGKIDELRVWNVVRTESQIQTAMSNVLAPLSNGLIAYYRFDAANSGGNNSNAIILQDLSINKNDGILSNFSLSGNTSNWVASSAIFSTFSSSNISICSSQAPYSWNGVDYSKSGIYTKTFTGGNSKGYDSIAVLNLTVSLSPVATITPSGATTFCSGSSVTLTGSGAITRNKALNLNGSQYLSTNGTPSISGDYTVEAWVYPTSYSSLEIFSTRQPSDQGFDFKLEGGNRIHGDIGNASGGWITTNADATFNYTTNTWYHIAFVVNSTNNTYAIYVNGNQIVQNSMNAGTALLCNTSHKISVGAYPNGGEYFNGKIDEVRIWNVSRTSAEIEANYQKLVDPSSTGLVVYYNMDEGSGTGVADATANHYNATYNGSWDANPTNQIIDYFYTYSWSPTAETTSSISASTTNNYVLTVGTTLNSCTSTASQTVTVNTPSSSTSSATACISYTWNGVTYTTSGTKTKVFPGGNSKGCDSTANLNLTINHPTSSTSTVSACVSYTWNGETYTTSGSYSKIFTGGNSKGCDSTANLNLTINVTSSSTNTTNVCANQLPYIWNGLTFNGAGTQTKTGLVNSKGCDSSATLTVTVGTPITPSVVINTATDTVCSGNNVTFTAIGTNSGSAPIYTWMKNGTSVGTGSTVTFLGGTLSNGDIISCVLTANNSCQTTATANSNSHTLTVKASPAIGSSTGFAFCSLGTPMGIYNTNTAGGGVWSSSNTSVATVTTASNGGTGLVSPISNGTSTLTYTKTSSNGCVSAASAIVTVAVPAVPNAITGANNICKGSTAQLNSTTLGGVWSITPTTYASISSAGLVNALTTGSATVKYTVTNEYGCSSFTTSSFTINAIPLAPSINYLNGSINPQTGAGGGFCANRTFTVVGAPTGGVWSKTGAINVNATTGAANTSSTLGAGSLTYTYTDANGCSNSKTLTGTVVACASRGVNGGMASGEQLVASRDFTMYPNPAKSFISLSVNTLMGSGSIVVTDLYGKQVKTQSLSMGTNTIDVSSFAKGIYFVSTITSEGKTTKKLVVE